MRCGLRRPSEDLPDMTSADRSGTEKRASGAKPAEGTRGGSPLRDTRAVSAFVLASSRDCALVLDLDGNTLFVSPGGIEAMELDDVDALIGHSWLRVWKDADHEAACAAVATARTGQSGRFQGYCATRTGTPKWWDIIISPLAAAGGQPARLVAMCRDITERREAEESLRASEAQFRTLAQAMPNHVWTAPANGLLDWFNDRVYDYSEAARGSLDGHGWASLVHPDDLPVAAPRWAAALASGEGYETEFRLRRADGVYRWHIARAVPIRGESGELVSWVGTNTDIDDQKTSAKALAHLNEYLEREVAERTADRNRLWRLSSDVMLVARFDGVITAVNPAGSALIGCAENEIVGRGLLDFVHPDDVEATSAAIARLSQRDSPARFQNRCRRKDGGVLWISWTAVPGDGFVNAVGRDFTAEKLHAEALRQTEEQLRQAQKMEAIGQLTGGVAHDFNNILQVISANLQLLGRIAAGNEKIEQRVDKAMGAVKRGAQLASQLLAFGRRQALEPKVVNVGRFVVAMEDMLRRALSEAIEIETVVTGGLWNTLVDPTQIENAVLNLAINARDAMHGSGKLTIEAGNASLDDTYVRRHADVRPGQYVMLAVSDTGSGMTPEVMAQAFEPFFSTKGEGQGTGLGLSMVYGFVKQSGGHVKIYSELGHGTVVKMYLPRSTQSEDVLTVADPSAASGGTETILVAEDDEEVRATVVEILSELGYRVLKAKDAAGALSIIESGARVDLLFTDVVMPGPLKSPELAHKARERIPGLGVLFTSGYTENAIVHAGRLDAGVDLLAKPYSREALALKLRQVLAARPPQVRPPGGN
jgi:PAS domain S-box-containing protein